MGVWNRVTDWGIQRDGDPRDPGAAYNAGTVRDVLRVGTKPADPLLVAADSSGVWLVDESGGLGVALSTTWTRVQTRSLALGFQGSGHVYAAGDALYETDVTAAAPLFAWRQIFIRNAGVWLNTGMINRVIVVGQRTAIILACDNGVFWARIPPAGGIYNFQPALLAPGLPGLGRCSGLVEGPFAQVVIGVWGTDRVDHFGIFNADWSGPGGSLVVTGRATITGINASLTQRIDLGACSSNRSVMYAVCGGGGPLTQMNDAAGNPELDDFANVRWTSDDYLYGVLRSKDGGLNWNVTSKAIDGKPDPLFGGMPAQDHAGTTQGGYNLCVGVSPSDSNLVAIGSRIFSSPRTAGRNGNSLAKTRARISTRTRTVSSSIRPTRVACNCSSAATAASRSRRISARRGRPPRTADSQTSCSGVLRRAKPTTGA
jgi:hypothetical protein